MINTRKYVIHVIPKTISMLKTFICVRKSKLALSNNAFADLQISKDSITKKGLQIIVMSLRNMCRFDQNLTSNWNNTKYFYTTDWF